MRFGKPENLFSEKTRAGTKVIQVRSGNAKTAGKQNQVKTVLYYNLQILLNYRIMYCHENGSFPQIVIKYKRALPKKKDTPLTKLNLCKNTIFCLIAYISTFLLSS